MKVVVRTHLARGSLLCAWVGLWAPGGPRPEAASDAAAYDPGVAVAMRDGVTLRADVWRPDEVGRYPTLVCRTPYGRTKEVGEETTRKILARGYALVVQDVRGRYDSEGEFNPYFQEGKDGFDTIEWAARQPWSTGDVGTFGLSYPGAAQWLAAIEGPPHLRAMVPAMTFSTPRNFIYAGGVFDGSWVAWIWFNIAPDVRVRRGLPGPRTRAEAARAWDDAESRLQHATPSVAATELRDVAPWYANWLAHPPEDSWWDALDLRGKYGRTGAAVLNLSGWYDEMYGPEGATTNFRGLVTARANEPDPRTMLVLGPWVHGIPGADDTRAGARDFGRGSALDYDELVLRWMDRYVRGIDNGVDREPRVRAFLMGENRWVDGNAWPLENTVSTTFYLGSVADTATPGALLKEPPTTAGAPTTFGSDPADPVTDPYPANTGAHDYRALAGRADVRVWETPPLEGDLRVLGPVTARVHLSCNAPDTDLWVKLLDVAPDGTALNLMSPGLDVVRASYRDGASRQLLAPDNVYLLELGNLITGNSFAKGHRIRVQVSATFYPHFSRNPHTGLSETTEAGAMRTARITIHHSREHPSSIALTALSGR